MSRCSIPRWARAEAAGWTGRVGADADHLKSPADVDVTAEADLKAVFERDPAKGKFKPIEDAPGSYVKMRD